MERSLKSVVGVKGFMIELNTDMFPQTSKLEKVPSTYSHERIYVNKCKKLQFKYAWTSIQALLAMWKVWYC